MRIASVLKWSAFAAFIIAGAGIAFAYSQGQFPGQPVDGQPIALIGGRVYDPASDTLIRSLESIDLVERAGTGWNSPLPMILKTVLVVGLFIYLIQLLMNLSRHFQSRSIEFGILLLTALIVARYFITEKATIDGLRAQQCNEISSN